MDVVPSFYNLRSTDDPGPHDNGFGNSLLRVGEVKRIIYPEDQDSRSKKIIEYDVLVQHRENDTAVTKLYQNCWLANELAGLADYSFRLLRMSTPQTGSTAGESSTVELGFGSKVLILCINAASSEAVILSGIRDERQNDKGRRDKGVHLEWEYNGVHVEIHDDGSWSVEYKGPTTADGKFDSSRGKTDTTGTKVEVSADGSFKVATRDSQQSIVIDHAAGTVKITGNKDLTLHADKIHIGDSAGEAAVLGDTLVKILGELLDEMSTATAPTPSGNTGPTFSAPKYRAIKAKLKTALSKFITVKKTP